MVTHSTKIKQSESFYENFAMKQNVFKSIHFKSNDFKLFYFKLKYLKLFHFKSLYFKSNDYICGVKLMILRYGKSVCLW